MLFFAVPKNQKENVDGKQNRRKSEEHEEAEVGKKEKEENVLFLKSQCVIIKGTWRTTKEVQIFVWKDNI